ncbi:hypothetical protein R6Q59_029654 [Mikania micrantha]
MISKFDLSQSNGSMDHRVVHTKRRIPHEGDVTTERVKAAFVVSDPVDWGRDIQVLCDILRSGGLPGEKSEHQPHMYFAADDLEYQAVFSFERLGMGAFRIALESIFNSIHHKPLKYTSFGKPNPFVYKNAESILMQLDQSLTSDADLNGEYKDMKSHHFKTLYMIGDNPSVDIKGGTSMVFYFDKDRCV